MSKVQQEKLLKFQLSDKKLIRLFNTKSLSKEDQFLLNYIYEEKQSLTFFYSVALPVSTSLVLNYSLFKNNSGFLNFVFFSTCFLTQHLSFKKRIEKRFNKLIGPYFEKYEIK